MMRSSLRLRRAVTFSPAAVAHGLASHEALVHAKQPPPPPPPKDLHTAAMEEARRHKWYVGERLGRDPGDAALKEWFRDHWLPFCRCKRLEHVEGQQHWNAFAEKEFGQVYGLILSEDLLLDRILDRMEHGSDNLEIINWALSWGLDLERVHEFLLMIDINRARLEPIAFP
jgi:hypothetical protein